MVLPYWSVRRATDLGHQGPREQAVGPVEACEPLLWGAGEGAAEVVELASQALPIVLLELRAEGPVHWELGRAAEDRNALLVEGEREANRSMRTKEVGDRVAALEGVYERLRKEVVVDDTAGLLCDASGLGRGDDKLKSPPAMTGSRPSLWSTAICASKALFVVLRPLTASKYAETTR